MHRTMIDMRKNEQIFSVVTQFDNSDSSAVWQSSLVPIARADSAQQNKKITLMMVECHHGMLLECFSCTDIHMCTPKQQNNWNITFYVFLFIIFYFIFVCISVRGQHKIKLRIKCFVYYCELFAEYSSSKLEWSGGEIMSFLGVVVVTFVPHNCKEIVMSQCLAHADGRFAWGQILRGTCSGKCILKEAALSLGALSVMLRGQSKLKTKKIKEFFWSTRNTIASSSSRDAEKA